MFYDLEDPVAFMRDVYEILADDGLWIFEQSYMPEMLRLASYDTICHEHLEYYGLNQIMWLAQKTGFFISDVSFNDANGGSFRVIAAKKCKKKSGKIDRILKNETTKLRLNEIRPYEMFKRSVYRSRTKLVDLITTINRKGQKVFGYGASTKGNTILQYCGLDSRHIPFIAEINRDKFGCYTPGTLIPIIDEKRARDMRPDYFLVLPWHFKKHIIRNEKSLASKVRNFIFPIPYPEIVRSR
jgi:hypothetical protein